MLNIWNIKNGIKMVSLNHSVPKNAFSIVRIAVSNNIQKKMDLRTFNALKVLNPSLLAPAHTPKKPSTSSTETSATYYSTLSSVRSIK